MHELRAYLSHSSITTTVEYYTEVEVSAAGKVLEIEKEDDDDHGDEDDD